MNIHKGQASREDQQVDPQLLQRFKQFLKKQKLQGLKNSFHRSRLRIYPINYQQQYNFKQEWQHSQNKQQEQAELQTFFVVLDRQNIYLKAMSVLIMLTNIFVCWNITLERVFNNGSYYQEGMIRFSILGIFNILIKFLLYAFLQSVQQKLVWSLHDYVGDALAISYFIIIQDQIIYQHYIMILVQITIICLYLFNSRQYYEYFKINYLSPRFRYQMRIVDILKRLIFMAHFTSMVLFLSSNYDKEQNWIKSNGMQNQDYIVKYVYSFYFALTTIVTTGYGDISPKNQFQVIIIVMIQLSGVIIFGYMVNDISQILMKRNRHEQLLQQEQAVLHKIRKNYGFSTKKTQKCLKYLEQNHFLQKVTTKDQNNVLKKLSEQERKSIIQNRSDKIIKSSLFWLSGWSKQMRKEVSKCIIDIIFNIGQILPQNSNDERLYLIKRGSVSIYLNKNRKNKRSKQYCRSKFLKKIQAKDQQQITHNLYGLTSVISQKPSLLEAISEDFTQCFFIKKDDFLTCIANNQKDFEYYHEIREKIKEQKIPQSYQVKNLKQSRLHYYPNKTFTIKKNLLTCEKNKNKRSFQLRNSRISNLVFMPSMGKIQQKITEQSDSKLSHKLNYKQDSMLYSTVQYLYSFGQRLNFQGIKQYSNYFFRNNITAILDKVKQRSKFKTVNPVKKIKNQKTE